MGSCAGCSKEDKSKARNTETDKKTQTKPKSEQRSPGSVPVPQSLIKTEPPRNQVYPNFSQNNRSIPSESFPANIERPRMMTVEEASQASEMEAVSSAINQLQRRREIGEQSMEQQPQEQHYIIEMNQVDLLFFLFRAIRRQDLNQQENALLFLRLLSLLSAQPEARGLTQEEIESLEVRKAKDNSHDCPVCQDTIKINEDMMFLPCKHPFHPSCIIPWVEKSTQCPVCRRSASRQN